MEINRLDGLMELVLPEKKALETSIDNLRMKEKERQESIATLKEMWKRNLQMAVFKTHMQRVRRRYFTKGQLSQKSCLPSRG